MQINGHAHLAQDSGLAFELPQRAAHHQIRGDRLELVEATEAAVSRNRTI